ncbi:hypothetical protein ACFLU5_03585 [Bacteroidota bacterium]
MPRHKIILIVIVGMCLLAACTKPPELPFEPKIVFERVQFTQTEEGRPDSLIVSIYFEDGNGDLGLTAQETQPPYHPADIVLDNNGDTVKYSNDPELPIYNPIDWQIIRDLEGQAKDTVLVEINENHYNFFVRFYQKTGGKYVEFDWRDEPYYQTFDGRFPYLRTDGDYSDHPLEGSLRYSMLSSGWIWVFRDTLKLSIQIQDRALNKSNTVETGDFTLDGVR